MVEFPLIRCDAASASGFSLGVQYYFYMYPYDGVVFTCTCMRALPSGMPDFTTFGIGCDIVACSGAGENT